MNYTDNQKTAIESHAENLQIIACAGSGKTQVISQRIIHLLKNVLATPDQIIAFTYTEKAAAELKARVLKLAREQLGTQVGLADMYIGTIHGWCMNTLQDAVLEFQKYSVLDEVKLALFVNKTYKVNGFLDLEMNKYIDTKHFTTLMGLIRESQLTGPLPPRLQSALAKYEATLHKYAYFDFTMIMSELANRMEADPGLREKLSTKIKFLIVDEYQDVNPVQERIIRSLHGQGANLCVVGDDDQTIYQWRGGDIRYILDFAKNYSRPDHPVKQVKLEDNFRSSQAVIETARLLVANNTRRLPKNMVARSHQAYELGDLLVHDFRDQQTEATWISETVSRIRGIEFRDRGDDPPRGLDYSDMVVLLRKWKKAEPLVEAFKKAGIPFVVAGVNHLFDQAEVQAAKGLFRYLKGLLDPDTLELMWKEVLPTLDETRFAKALKHLNQKKPHLIRIYHEMNLQEIFQDFLEDAGITERVLLAVDRQGALDHSYGEIVLYNLGMFSQVVQDFETIHFTDGADLKLTGFLSFLQYSAETIYPEGWLSNAYQTPNAVQIMTVHQAKGLEYPVVFIPGLNKNYFPAQRQGGRQVWHFIDSGLVDGVDRYKGTVEDERRLMYVALTRAKKFLFLSHAPSASRNDQVPSIFLTEAKRANFLMASPNRDWSERSRATPRPGEAKAVLELNFSLMKSLFDCPWTFKLYNLYGFNEPLNQRLGYGQTLHHVLMEMHRRAIEGHSTTDDELPALLDRHESFPYALGEIRQAMHDKSEKYLQEYLNTNREDFSSIKFAERDIQLDLGDGVLINGRIDLIKKKDVAGRELTYLIDYKSKEDVQTKRLTMQQLYLYALGYEALTGGSADMLQIFDMEKNAPENEEISTQGLQKARNDINKAVVQIRTLDLDHSCGKPDCGCRLRG